MRRSCRQPSPALTRGKTLIMIAHRLNTVRNANQILVLSGGHIVQRGTHQELMAQGGLYLTLWVSARGAQVEIGYLRRNWHNDRIGACPLLRTRN